jgi:hypothetical protein
MQQEESAQDAKRYTVTAKGAKRPPGPPSAITSGADLLLVLVSRPSKETIVRTKRTMQWRFLAIRHLATAVAFVAKEVVLGAREEADLVALLSSSSSNKQRRQRIPHQHEK